MSKRPGTYSATGSAQLSAEKLKKRRDQNRISQRMFRLRKEKHASDLEAKVEELEALLKVTSHENSLATARMSKMEVELCYYRGLLFATTNQRNTFVTSYPSSEYRPSGNRFGVGGETSPYANMSYSYLLASRGSLAVPVIGNEYHRTRNYDTCSTGAYSPA